MPTDRQEITFFEITTVAAISPSRARKADWTLLEVGLGGRLDATNVVEEPKMTVITPVDYDHQQYLGETLPEIAGEKAGIIKRGRAVRGGASARAVDGGDRASGSAPRRAGACTTVSTGTWPRSAGGLSIRTTTGFWTFRRRTFPVRTSS
jgi:hypothetical protein